ncbi:MAG: MarR family transcriptional regulator [Smithellaceae bacterium]|jgi:DNA-binding MarR family transcriptional regulator|nr:MarR family transcriptional regulator [Smithellaceae bacterium]
MKDKKEYLEVGDLFYQVLSKYMASERVPKSFGIKQKLHPSEIHMIHGIGRRPDINVTELAKFLGITKGAVPKMIKKLTSKGLVKSLKSAKNGKEVCLRLTDEGKKAHKGYLQYHKKRGKLIQRYYNRLTEEEIRIITETLNALGRLADRILEK